MEKLHSFLILQDSLSSQMKLTINGKSSYHSLIGIILSFLINIACISLIINYISILISHTRPNINYMKSSSSIPPNLTLNTDDLIFTIGFRDTKYKIVNDPTILTIEATYQIFTSQNGIYNTQINNLDFMNCSNISNYFYKKNLGKIFESGGLIDNNCFSWKGGNITLGGHFGTNFYGTVNITFKKCVNNTKNNFVCKSQEYIDYIIQYGWLEITYITAYVDFYNFSDPIQYITEDFYKEADTKLTKSVNMYFNPLYFYSENNILFSNKKMEKVIKFDRYTTDTNKVSENRQNIYVVNLISSTVMEKYFRKYDKIQDFASNVGGLWYGLRLIAFVIMCHYNERELNCFIANSLFTFVPLKENEKKYSIFVNINKRKLSKINKNKIFSHYKKNNINFNLRSKTNKKENLTTSEYQLKNNVLNSNINNQFQIKKDRNFLVLPKNLNPWVFYNQSRRPSNKSMIITDEKNDNITNIEKIKKINYNFGKLTYTLLCSCTKIGKNLSDEYEKVVKELRKYSDFIKLSFNLFDLEKIKEIIIDKKLSEDWVSKSKIVFINELPNTKSFCSDKPKLLKENILNNKTLMSKNRNNEENKIKPVSLFIKMKGNENKNSNNEYVKDNYFIEVNLLDENESQAKNNKNKNKENNRRNSNSAISSFHRELKKSSLISADLK